MMNQKTGVVQPLLIELLVYAKHLECCYFIKK